jgi:7,8-dihydropterin-6-yl-methyl-4-(beta-D-ribofuranosyl)aminobenzene 5'-phosphate synthase
MAFRISPLWWPVLAGSAPAAIPLILLKTMRFMKNRTEASERNRARLAEARPLDLPELEFLEIVVLEEWRAHEGFHKAAGVSYLLRTNLGSLLFDVGYGPVRGALSHNAPKLGVRMEDLDALVVSHLHLDHMGGLQAQREKRVVIPPELGSPEGQPCFLPDQAEAGGFEGRVVERPALLPTGIATTGPLARSLFFFGLIEEQALLASIRGKGLVVLTGCGHPTVPLILEMTRRLSNLPIHALVGGLHFPIKHGRGGPPGVQPQMIFGTGKPVWRSIGDTDLDEAIGCINQAGPQRLLLSAHDTCDHSLARFRRECDADVEVLCAGGTYRL